MQYLDFFTVPESYAPALKHEYPGESFAYLEFATRYKDKKVLTFHNSLVLRLPRWDNKETQELVNRPLFEGLARHWRITIAEVVNRVNQEGIFIYFFNG
jgi:hypothetical protein